MLIHDKYVTKRSYVTSFKSCKFSILKMNTKLSKIMERQIKVFTKKN